MRGYYGIGIYNTKTESNVGTLWRSAYNFGANFIFTIGKRYKKQSSDTVKACRHIPLYEYLTYEDFKSNIPNGCQIVCIEISEKAKDLKDFKHPERCIYLLGAEDYGIPEKYLTGNQVVKINSKMCLNVASTGSIVMYDRQVKYATP